MATFPDYTTNEFDLRRSLRESQRRADDWRAVAIEARERADSTDRRLALAVAEIDRVHGLLHQALKIASEEVEREAPVGCPVCEAQFVDGTQMNSEQQGEYRRYCDGVDAVTDAEPPFVFVGLLDSNLPEHSEPGRRSPSGAAYEDRT